ncbi:MAG: hypothetical protein CVU90_08890 [Firmicutes bacterium HGW-Firmicutes-15]|nr:MAG: hypothetical protein CVU90_08890 [Firmicutes bacterium HGW-Firmicutes-15]
MQAEKSKEELLEELEDLRRQVSEMKKSATEANAIFESLKESEERFRGLFENASDGIWAQDLKGNFTWANKITETTTGYTLKEFLGMNIAEIITPESLQEARKIKQRLMNNELLPVYELDVKTKDGRVVPLELNSHLIMKNGEPFGVEAILRDISERKRIEQAHHDSEVKYRALMDYSSDAIVLAEFEGDLIEVNRKAESLLGYLQEDLLNMRFIDLHPQEEAERIEGGLAELYEKGSTYLNDILVLTKSGRTFPAESTATIVEYGGKKLIQAVIHDITKRKRNQEIITRQAQEIMEISTPVVQIWDNVLAAPVIGTLDSQRAEQFTERLLNKIVETNSPIALVDITGVPAIDTRTAQHLIDTISAVQLLGGQAILTGVRPAIAQTLVHLGINLNGVVTRPSLAAGLQVAFQKLGLQIKNNNEL